MRRLSPTALLLGSALLASGLSGCARHGINLFEEDAVPAKIEVPAIPTPVLETEGMASFYSDKFSKRRTASGKPYLPNQFTAAHPSAPFGTVLLVTNKENGRSVEVVVTDRGPFTKGRIIDLSRAAAQSLGMIQAGVAPVSIRLQPKSTPAALASNLDLSTSTSRRN